MPRDVVRRVLEVRSTAAEFLVIRDASRVVFTAEGLLWTGAAVRALDNLGRWLMADAHCSFRDRREEGQ